jgi:hypothetical protein
MAVKNNRLTNEAGRTADDLILMQMFPGSTFKGCTIEWRDGVPVRILAGDKAEIRNAVIQQDDQDRIKLYPKSN